MTNTQTFEVGDLVTFRPTAVPYLANEGVVYMIEASPDGAPYSLDASGRRYVWLVAGCICGTDPTVTPYVNWDSGCPCHPRFPGNDRRPRRRSGWVSDLIAVQA